MACSIYGEYIYRHEGEHKERIGMTCCQGRHLVQRFNAEYREMGEVGRCEPLSLPPLGIVQPHAL